MWKVKVAHCSTRIVSAIEIYYTFERFAVKIHRRVFVSCSRGNAGVAKTRVRVTSRVGVRVGVRVTVKKAYCH